VTNRGAGGGRRDAATRLPQGVVDEPGSSARFCNAGFVRARSGSKTNGIRRGRSGARHLGNLCRCQDYDKFSPPGFVALSTCGGVSVADTKTHTLVDRLHDPGSRREVTGKANTRGFPGLTDAVREAAPEPDPHRGSRVIDASAALAMPGVKAVPHRRRPRGWRPQS